MLYSFVASQVANCDEALEITQEAFTQGFDGISGLREPAAWPGFIRTIAARIVFARREKSAHAPAALPESADIRDAGAPTPARAAERAEFERSLHAALQEFPPIQREALLLRLVDGLKHREIGERLGLGLDQAKGLVTRGLLRLSETLRPFLEESR